MTSVFNFQKKICLKFSFLDTLIPCFKKPHASPSWQKVLRPPILRNQPVCWSTAHISSGARFEPNLRTHDSRPLATPPLPTDSRTSIAEFDQAPSRSVATRYNRVGSAHGPQSVYAINKPVNLNRFGSDICAFFG